MTGTIKSLDVGSATGVITAEDGLIVGFCPSAVLQYDVPTLAIGQVVSFELEGGRCPKALNVCVQRPPHGVNGQRKAAGDHAPSLPRFRAQREYPGLLV